MKKKKTGKKGKFDRSALKERLLKRTEESYASKESSGKFANIFRSDLKLPLWKPKEGDHLYNVIPYITGKYDPKLKEGEVSYVLDIWVHTGVGINEDRFVCPARNYNRPCPICERQKEMRLLGTFTDDEIKSLNPKRRAVYNVQVLDSAEEENKGVQIWEVSHWLTERLFSELARKPKGGGFIPFSDPDNGKMLALTMQTKQEYIGHKMLDREEEITDALLEAAYTLDELIYIPDYTELYAAFYGTEFKEEEVEEELESEEKPVKKKSKPKPEPEPEPEPEEDKDSYEDDWEDDDSEDSDEDKDEWEDDDETDLTDDSSESLLSSEEDWEEDEEDEEPEPPKKTRKKR